MSDLMQDLLSSSATLVSTLPIAFQMMEELAAKKTPAGPALAFRGNNALLQSLHDPEVILSGPSETGKTLAALTYVDALARRHPKATGAIVRKIRHDMDSTVLAAFKRYVLREDVTVFGGEKPEFYEYPNGARIWIGGMDRPGKVLSGALDFCYVNQAEELALADWETLSTRTTGRAGVIVPGILCGDCNPGPPGHWIKQRPSLRLLETRHEDNPVLFDDAGHVTAQGAHTLAALDALTGVRYLRLRKGLWVQAEGVVYDEFDPAIHVVDEMPAGWEAWTKIGAVDLGYSNPFVYQRWAIDPDGRMYLFREFYMTHRLVEDHAEEIKRLGVQRVTVADHDAEDRATLERHGVPTAKADKRISAGIEAVKSRLRRAGDGKPRLFVLRSCLVERDESLAERHLPVSTLQEFELYAWPKAADGRPLKEIPIDLYNHGMDALRYAVMALDNDVPSASAGTTEARRIHAPRGRSSWRH